MHFCTGFSSHLMRYWHMGSRRKARATVAMTAVQEAKSICMESKKKNMTNKEMEAPKGRHIACILSRVCTSAEMFVIKILTKFH